MKVILIVSNFIETGLRHGTMLLGMAQRNYKSGFSAKGGLSDGIGRANVQESQYAYLLRLREDKEK